MVMPFVSESSPACALITQSISFTPTSFSDHHQECRMATFSDTTASFLLAMEVIIANSETIVRWPPALDDRPDIVGDATTWLYFLIFSSHALTNYTWFAQFPLLKLRYLHRSGWGRQSEKYLSNVEFLANTEIGVRYIETRQYQSDTLYFPHCPT